jgi:hypothetical protein
MALGLHPVFWCIAAGCYVVNRRRKRRNRHPRRRDRFTSFPDKCGPEYPGEVGSVPRVAQGGAIQNPPSLYSPYTSYAAAKGPGKARGRPQSQDFVAYLYDWPHPD